MQDNSFINDRVLSDGAIVNGRYVSNITYEEYSFRYYSNGDKVSFKDGMRHAIDCPAFEGIDGSKAYYEYGKLHRLDGPAIINSDGSHLWFFKGIYIPCRSQEKFLLLIKDCK